MDIYSGFSDFSSLNLPRNGDFSQVCVTWALHSVRALFPSPQGVNAVEATLPQVFISSNGSLSGGREHHPASFILCLTCFELRLI